jgi:hypothetical protein
MIESIKDLLQKEAQAVLNIPITDAYEKAVNLIIEQIHIKKGKLVTSGKGRTNSHEHRNDLLLYGHPLRFPASERSATRRFGHLARK